MNEVKFIDGFLLNDQRDFYNQTQRRFLEGGVCFCSLRSCFVGFTDPYGFWPSHFREIQVYSQGWNASLWPASIPIGLALAVAAVIGLWIMVSLRFLPAGW